MPAIKQAMERKHPLRCLGSKYLGPKQRGCFYFLHSCYSRGTSPFVLSFFTTQFDFLANLLYHYCNMSSLVIVESPTKAKTISKFLGKGFIVESSFGHVRDLPKGKMGVDIKGGTFEPNYVVPKERSAQVTKLKKLSKNKEVIFATDEDREGEAISWHLAQVLDIKPEDAKRIAFHEITKHAIDEALKNPRHIDLKLVDAQQARRVLDRLVGYELSPLLWKKVAKGLSAGRVQSVAVRLIVEREREIKKFVAEEYWSIEGIFSQISNNKYQITTQLHAIDDKKLDKLDLKTQAQVDAIVSDAKVQKYSVSNLESKETKRTPAPPFTTSTLQQAANQKCGYSAKQAMRLAQQLYEGIELGSEGSVGLITYMRTDSVNLSEKFLQETNDYVKITFGDKYTLPKFRAYKNTSKGAQEAHEAIRPTDPMRDPKGLEPYLDPQQFKLYSLIWRRAVATQMADARLNKTLVDIAGGKYLFRANGQTMLFDGWLKLYPESMKEEILPELKKDEALDCKELKPEQHFTEPPARYSDATLVKAMEEFGIGRPSTYAPTIATIEDRHYVERDDNKKLKPTDIAFVVIDLLVEHFPQIVDYQFTAQMEENLDEIAEGTKDWKPIIATFYEPFHANLMNKMDEISKKDATSAREIGVDPKDGKIIYARIGRFGPYVQKGEAKNAEGKTNEEKPQFASLKKGQSIDTITLEDALQLLSLPRSLGNDETGNEVTVSIGRFGPYVKIGKAFTSIRTDDPYTITLERALEVVKTTAESKGKTVLKEFAGSEIKIMNGRYGPYITDGKKNLSVPKDTAPESLELAQCEEMLKNAPEKKKRFFRKKK